MKRYIMKIRAANTVPAGERPQISLLFKSIIGLHDWGIVSKICSFFINLKIESQVSSQVRLYRG